MSDELRLVDAAVLSESVEQAAVCIHCNTDIICLFVPCDVV